MSTLLNGIGDTVYIIALYSLLLAKTDQIILAVLLASATEVI